MAPTPTTRRRLAVTMLIVVTMIALFVVRLVDIQVVRANDLNEASYGKRAVAVTTYGPRGDIVDAHGQLLAGSIMRYDAQISPVMAKEADRRFTVGESDENVLSAAEQIGAITGQSAAEIVGIINKALADNPESNYAMLIKAVDLEQYRAMDALDIPWLFFTTNPGRTYPNGAVAGNLVGFVGVDGAPLEGLEWSMDSCLAGTDGEQLYEKSLDGVRLPGSTVTTKDVVKGGQLKLTIDLDLQWYAQQALAERVQEVGGTHGMVIVQEVKTGKLLAVAEYPSVDPNNFEASDPEDRSSRAFRDVFEPGSTLKALTAAALVDAGLAEPTSRVVAPYSIRMPNGAQFHDSDWHPDEQLTLTGVLVDSSNTGTALFGDKMSDAVRHDYLEKFGIGQKTAVGFDGEASGVLHPYEDWDNQTKYATMFGQGLSMTSVQVASSYQALGNGGVRLPVQLVEGCTAPDGSLTDVPPASDGVRVVSESAADTTVNMLEGIVTKGWLKDVLTIPGYRVAAKTGTAQQADGEGGYQSRYLVSLAGMAPAEDPQYVVSVNIANPVTITSSGASAPVFQKVMTQVLKTNRVKPSTTPSPDLPTHY